MPKLETETRKLSRLLGSWTALARGGGGTVEMTTEELRILTARALEIEQDRARLRARIYGK